MPSINKHKHGVQSVDFLGSKFKIGYSTLTGKFQTKLGGYLTILMGLLSTGFFFVVMSQFFNKETPIVMTSTESGSREAIFDLYQGDLYLPLGFLLGPKAIPARQINRYVTIKAFVDEAVFNPDSAEQLYNLTPRRYFSYKPCSLVKDPKITQYLELMSTLPGFKDLMSCPDFEGHHEDFVVSSNYVTYASNWTLIKIYPCSLPDPTQCASAAEINALKVEYGFPSKLLKPSDYKNPVESLPVRVRISIDPRSTKVIKEVVKRNKVFDDTLSLVPAKLKEEYTTLHEESIDLSVRDQTQLHCSRDEVEKGVLGRCPEYISFDYIPSSEVVVTTRSYKKLTAMLGEFGGILKIITTTAFFVYGVYSMRKVKSLLGGIIFEDEEGPQKSLKRLVEGKEEISQMPKRLNKVRPKDTAEAVPEELSFQMLVERFVSRRSNVDNLMKKLNLLELIEKAVFKEHEKELIPLVLLKAEKSEVKSLYQKEENSKNQKPDLGGTQIIGKNSSSRQTAKKSTNPIISIKGLKTKSPSEGKSSYQQAFDSLLNSHPDSQFSKVIKEYMVSQLEGTFSESSNRPYENFNQQEGSRQKFKHNRSQKIELFGDEERNKKREEDQTPEKKLMRKQDSGGTGYMRPTNSPLRIRRRTCPPKKGPSRSNNTPYQ